MPDIKQDKQQGSDDKAAADEVDLASEEVRNSFGHFRQLHAARPCISSPILDGNLVSDKKQKVECWRLYCERLLNHQPKSPPADLL